MAKKLNAWEEMQRLFNPVSQQVGRAVSQVGQPRTAQGIGTNRPDFSQPQRLLQNVVRFAGPQFEQSPVGQLVQGNVRQAVARVPSAIQRTGQEFKTAFEVNPQTRRLINPQRAFEYTFQGALGTLGPTRTSIKPTQLKNAYRILSHDFSAYLGQAGKLFSKSRLRTIIPQLLKTPISPNNPIELNNAIKAAHFISGVEKGLVVNKPSIGLAVRDISEVTPKLKSAQVLKGITRQEVPTKMVSRQKVQLQPELQVSAPLSRTGGGDISSLPPRMPVGQPSKYAFNINKQRLQLSPSERQTLDTIVERVKPELETLRGKTLSNQEIVQSARKSSVLQQVTTREQTLQAEAAMLKARQRLVELDKNIDHLAKSGNTQTLQNEMRDLIESLKVVSSTAADTGRKLQALSIGAGGESTRVQVLKEIAKTNNNADEILKQAMKVNWNDANSITKFYRQFIKPSWSEILDEYRYNNMLSNPRTHLRNLFSNLTQTFITRPTTLITEGKPIEATRYLGGALKSFPQAIDDFVKSFRGETAIAKPDIQIIGTGKLPRFMTIPTRAMEAGDRFFSALIRGGEVARGATPEKAAKIAEYSLFRQGLKPEGQGSVLNAIDSITGWTYKAPKPVRWFAPFIRTPMNFAKQWIEYSPTGVTTLIGAGNKREQLAKAILGSTITAFGASVALQGRTTWEAPTNPKEKEYFYASGRKPFSIQIGDKWIPMIYAGPFAFALALPTAVRHHWTESKTAPTDSEINKLVNISSSMARFLAGQTFLEGIGNFVKWASGDVDYSLPSSLGFTAGQIIPMEGLVRYINTILDPVYRKGQGFTGSIQKNIPILSKQLEAYTLPSGEESRRESSNYILPFDIGRANQKFEQGYGILRELGRIKRESTRESKEQKEKAQQIRDSFKGLSQGAKLEKWTELVKSNRVMAKRVKEIIQEEQLGLTSIDKSIKSLGVEDESRAKFLYQEFKKLTSQAEKTKLWNDYVKKKIITPEVRKQIIYLINK